MEKKTKLFDTIVITKIKQMASSAEKIAGKKTEGKFYLAFNKLHELNFINREASRNLGLFLKIFSNLLHLRIMRFREKLP